MIKLTKDIQFIIVTFILLTLWFGIFFDQIIEWATQNYIFAYGVFLLGYVFLIMKYVLEIDPLKSLKKYVAFLLVFLAGDIVIFPYLIGKTGPVTTNAGANLSSDVFVYNFINNFYLTFIVVPLVFLVVARMLVKKERFMTFVKQSV